MKEQYKKESPILSIVGLGGGGTGFALGGVKGSSGPLYADDVFSTFLYDGNSTPRTIPNNIDLLSEGGLVWVKHRGGQYNISNNHHLADTVRGGQKILWSNQHSAGSSSDSSSITGFTTGGFTIGNGNEVNQNNQPISSWSFRKSAGFFDVVAYNGNGDNSRTIPHSLGSEPGMIFLKRLNLGANWPVYHKSRQNISEGNLDNNYDFTWGAGTWFYHAGMSSSTFGVNNQPESNATGGTYIAYLFANDSAKFGANNDESIIKCGSYMGSTSSISVNLGFEPQWLMIKDTTGGQDNYNNWVIFDNMRGLPTNDNDTPLAANLDTSENGTYLYGTGNPANLIDLTPNGFEVDPGASQFSSVNTNGKVYIYMAIRRSHKPAISAADVFKVHRQATGSQNVDIDYGITADLVLFKKYNSSSNNNQPVWVDRLRGQNEHLFSTTTALSASNIYHVDLDRQIGIRVNDDPNNWFSYQFSYRHYVWKRAAGFFDMVTWRGEGTGTQNVSHNLGVAPEMVIVKMFEHPGSNYGGDRWYVYHKNLGTDTGGGSTAINSILGLNENMSQYSFSGGGIFGSAPTATNLPFDNPGYDSLAVTGDTDITWIAYLFASVEGVSKLGYYTGAAAGAYSITLSFTPKFLMIKAADRTGDWIVFDSERGFTVGGTSAEGVALNNTDNESQTNETDAVRAGTNKFVVIVANASTDINENGKKYIYYAIA